MAQKTTSKKLDSRTARMKLAAGKRHQARLGEGCYLAYYRPKGGGAGSWKARSFDKETKVAGMHPLGEADDLQAGDGVNILDYAAAKVAAEAWFKELREAAHVELTGERLSKGPWTVAEAMQEYLTDAEVRGVKGVAIMTATINAHINPELGGIPLKKLTKPRIEKWLVALAQKPRRRTSRGSQEVVYLDAPITEDEKRARKDSANRVLTNLKAGLNLAVKNKRYTGPTPWRDVTKFKGVGSARVRFLTVAEQQRLVNASPEGFKQMVQAALYTGCRYGELCRLRVRDYNATAKTLFIETSKSGKPRHIALTDEAVAWFNEQVAGRGARETLLIKPNALGKIRKHQEDPYAWGQHDQKKLMAEVCKKAKVEALGFHELRHTYASGLVNAGIPLAYVAAQLGHVDTAMVEKHYGHLSSSALAESIRKNSPKLGISEPKTTELEVGKRAAK